MANPRALRQAIVAVGRMRPPKDPVPKKKPKTGATSEAGMSEGENDYYSKKNPDGGIASPQKPTKTTEGREPWQYDTNGQTPAEGAPRLVRGSKRRNTRYS